MGSVGVFDIETDGLMPDVSTVWCVGHSDMVTGTYCEHTILDITLPQIMQCDTIIGHNIISYDLPVIKKIYGYAPKQGAKLVDTLILSRLLCRDRPSHSLASWGDTLGFPKGDHTDWTKYTPEMGAYCKRDVDVTVKLYLHLMEIANAS